MLQNNSHYGDSVGQRRHTTTDIVIAAVVGALLGLGVCFVVSGLRAHRASPSSGIAPVTNTVKYGGALPQGNPAPVAYTQQPTQYAGTPVTEARQALATTPNRTRAVVVCIDAGHPSEVSSGKVVQNGLQEVVVNWNVAEHLRQILEANGYKVVRTKTRWDEMVTNKRRAEIANDSGASLLIRLHCDTGGSNGYTLYYPNKQGKKNGKIGPPLSVIKESSIAAKAIHNGMAQMLRGTLRDDGVKGDTATKIGGQQGALTGSIYSNVPTVTVEMVFLSSKTDAAFIRTEKGQEKMAYALATGIAQYIR